MDETGTYLVAFAQGAAETLSGRPHIEKVLPVLEELLKKCGPGAGQVQEIHWHGGDDDYWLGGLGEAQGFAQDVARFHWPVTPLLPHAMLHLVSRSIDAGQRDLVLLAQETGGQVIALLLASVAAAGRLNAAPPARIGLKLAVSSAQGGLLQASGTAWEQSGRDPRSVRWITSARRGARTGEHPFPSARWLDAEPDTPAGDLFMLAALAVRLGEDAEGAGLLFTGGPTKSGFVTFLESA